MLTRCPACETTFRVTPEQLKARAGRVRCGQCQHAFNALDTLIDETLAVAVPPPVALAVAPSFTEPVGHAPEAEVLVIEEAPVVEVGEPEAIESAPQPVPPAPTFDVPATDERVADESVLVEPVADEAPAAEMPKDDVVVAAALEPLSPTVEEPEPVSETAGIVEAPEPLADSPFFAEPDEPRLWPWITGALLALVAIAFQATIAFRVELATLVPDAKPGLVGICELIGCEVGLPAKVELLSIESSDLHPDPAQAGKLGLAATLKNRAPFAQMYPHLELTLTDTADKAIVRKVLAPADYLPPKTNLKKGMQANADLAVAIGIDPGDLPASGYRLYLFYP